MSLFVTNLDICRRDKDKKKKKIKLFRQQLWKLVTTQLGGGHSCWGCRRLACIWGHDFAFGPHPLLRGALSEVERDVGSLALIRLHAESVPVTDWGGARSASAWATTWR